MTAERFGRYLGFLVSMLIFSTILFYITSKFRFHSIEWYIFIPTLLIVFPLMFVAKRKITGRQKITFI